MRKLLYFAVILFLYSCGFNKKNLRKVKVSTDFYSIVSEQYIYTQNHYTLYIVPILSEDDRLANYEEVPPNFKCYLEENNNSTGIITSCYDDRYGKIKLSPVDSVLDGIGSIYSRDKNVRPAFNIYQDYKVIGIAYDHGNKIETIVPNKKDYDCSYPDTTYVTHNKNYNWITKISLSDDESKRKIKISKIHNIFNARYCSEYKQSINRRSITYSLEEVPIKNPAKIDSIFAKLIPYLPKK